MRPIAALGAALVLGGILVAPPLHAQPASAALRGRVVDAASGAPLEGAGVILMGPDQVARPTDAGGFFVLTGLTPGRYALRVTLAGYRPHLDSLTLDPGARAVRGITLHELALPEMLVEQAPPEGIGATRLTAEALAHIPSVAPGGDAGVLLAALPGVVAFEEGGQLFVRGGEAVHALFLVDGVPVYQPLHAAGGLLGVPPGAVAYVDAWPGAAPARLGGRLGAAFEVGLRAGDRQRLRARGALGTFLAAAQAEGPVVPGAASLLVAGRAQAFGAFRPTGTDRRFGLYDGLARLHAFLSPLATLTATALATGDDVDASAGARSLRYRWHNRAAGLRLNYLPEAFPVQTDLRIYRTTLRAASDLEQSGERRSEVTAVGGEIALRYLLGRQTLGVGLFGTTTHFGAETPRTGASPLRDDEYLTEGGTYVEAVLLRGLLRVEPGIRVHGYPSRRTTPSIEPRLRLAYGTPRWRLHAATSIQRQEVAGDVLGAGAADVFVAWRPSVENAPLPSAVHAELGAEAAHGRAVQVSLVGWHRRLAGLGAGTTTARASGLDATLDAAQGPVALRLAYGYSHVRYRRDRLAFSPPHDRPHRIDVLARLAPGHGLRLDARFAAGTGTPFRRVRGYVDDLPGPPFNLDGPTRPLVLEGESDRLPVFARLDLLAAVTRTQGELTLELQAGLQNTLGRRNVV
ncbi:MAG TPA: carboxypeptidase regulatory-like domain-containing protein, partial [Rhodothermales bacterium]|nr:carboxypeptidase regulatory-like domain-containing protein [Rhodothermales bacterium]